MRRSITNISVYRLKAETDKTFQAIGFADHTRPLTVKTARL